MNFEKCLTEHFLFKKGMDYFGKRDFIYIDMIGTNDAKMFLDVDFWKIDLHKDFCSTCIYNI